MTDAAAAALSPMPPPAIRIEKECLHDAEEAGTYSRLSNRRRLLIKSSLNFHITILIHFYINLGIGVIFLFFFHQHFQTKSDL